MIFFMAVCSLAFAQEIVEAVSESLLPCSLGHHQSPFAVSRVQCTINSTPATIATCGASGIPDHGIGSWSAALPYVTLPCLTLPCLTLPVSSPGSLCCAAVWLGHTGRWLGYTGVPFACPSSVSPPFGQVVHRALCAGCAKSRLISTTGSHGSQRPEFCTLQSLLVHQGVFFFLSLMLATGPRVLNSAPHAVLN